MTARPLMNRTIGELEDIFEGGKSSLVVLGGLGAELMHRNVPRARALLARVQSAQKRLAAAPKYTRTPDLIDLSEGPGADANNAILMAHVDAGAVATTRIGSGGTFPKDPPRAELTSAPRQPDLPLASPVGAAAASAPRPATAPDQANGAAQPAAVPSAPVATMSRVEAMAVLKVPASARWEVIELARREIVDRARPDRLEAMPASRREAVHQEARIANEAFRSLLALNTAP